MIYLNNNTNPQEIFIERNDGNGYIHTGSSQSYQEGYVDGVNDQKAKLASTEFTENGDYQRNDGWSAITVNVPQSGSVLEGKEIVVSQDITIVVPTSGYDGFSSVTVDATDYGQTNYDNGFDDGFIDGYSSGSSEGYDSGYTEGYQSGSTDGFNSGYTSGETHQKSLLGTTAFTINGSYSAENGYSAITVNVPTGQTYNIEQNKPFTATSNGNYTIKPSEIWSITYDNTFARRYDFTINGTIPQSFVNDTAYVVRYYDEITEEEPIVIIKVGSGNTLYLNKNGWDEDDYGDVYFRLYQGKYRLEFDNDDLDSSEFSIIPYSNGEKYDVMSAVSLNVNIDTSSTYQSGYTSGHTDGKNSIISTFTAMTATTNGVYGSSANPLSSITVDVPQTGSSSVLGVGSFSANGTYSASTDNLDGYSAITVNVPQASPFGDLYCLYCENCEFGFAYTVNSELASITNIAVLALPQSDFLMDYAGDLDETTFKKGKMQWTDKGDGYHSFSGNWETYSATYSTSASTPMQTNSFPNMHTLTWDIYATKTYSVDSQSLKITQGGAAPDHTSKMNISGNSYYLVRVHNGTQYCDWSPAVDDNGNACLVNQGKYKYPISGSCYPVYRKLVNGDYVYRVVKPISVGDV